MNRALADIIAQFNRAGYLVTTYVTAAAGDAANAAAELGGGMDLVVCAGGDGTLNETITGVLRAGLDVPLGYIPCGSTNDFAASLGLPTDPTEAVEAIITGTPEQFDIGRFGQRYFSYVASFGAFTKASYATPQSVKNTLGHTAYVLAGITELSQIRELHVRLEIDGETVEDDFLFGAISNSTSVGGILTLAPSLVDMRDGKFEVLLVRKPRDIWGLGECVKALQSQTYNCSMITFRPASRVRITASADMGWTLDGEYEPGHETVEVENLHNAIRLVCRRAADA